MDRKFNSILEIIINNADNYPDRLCVVDEDGEYTYADVLETAENMAAVFAEHGVTADSCVMVECNQRASYIAADFACNILGAYFTPIENKASQDRVSGIADESEAVLLVAASEYDVPCDCIGWDEAVAEPAKPCKAYDMPEAGRTSELLYTTGTTGKSKGIEITYANNVALAENIAYGTEMREGNVEIIPLPISHSHGIRCCYANFLRAGTVVLIDGVVRVKKIFDLMEKYSITAMDVSPTAAAVLMQMSKNKFGQYDGQLDYIQVGTAALSEEIKKTLKDNFPTTRLYNFYGSTESGRSCVLNFNSDYDRKNCIGKPTVNARFIVVDDEHNVIESSESNTGLLACAGAMNMKGYWKQPELTAATMQNGYVYTSDEAYIDERGYVYVLGRKDDIINYKGIKIAPEEIEDVACGFEGVADAGCIAVADKVSGQYPKLYIQLEDGTDFDLKEFRQHIAQHIDPNKKPKEIEVIDAIPRTFNGKLQRKVLREMNNK